MEYVRGSGSGSIRYLLRNSTRDFKRRTPLAPSLHTLESRRTDLWSIEPIKYTCPFFPDASELGRGDRAKT